MGMTIAVLFGPLVWAGHFAVLYGTHASLCAAAGRHGGSPEPLVPVFALSTAVALLLVLLPLTFPERFAALFFAETSEAETRFLVSLMRWLAGLSMIAVAANALSVMVVPAC